MNNDALSAASLCVSLFFVFNGCQTTADEPYRTDLSFTVQEAPEWTALFTRYSGWFGADGIFAIPLNGRENEQADTSSKTLLIFSDTLIGEIEEGELQSPFSLINNSTAVLVGSEAKQEKIRFNWSTKGQGEPQATFIPESTPDGAKDYYWLGDGFVNTELDSTLYIFAYRMRNLDSTDDWSFHKMGTDLISIPKNSKSPFTEQRKIKTPLDYEEGGFGPGILVNTKAAGSLRPDGFIYVYGVRGKQKDLVVARVKPADFEKFDVWRYWDGKQWNRDMNSATTLASNVSNELSVSVLPDGRFALVYQHESMSPRVVIRIADTPQGSFGPMMDVWYCKEAEAKNIFAYNAKAHPSLSAPGELLISYNVNAFDFWNEIKKDPNLYRPRFVKIKFHIPEANFGSTN